MNFNIPICFQPIRKIILDDDNAFAESIKLKMLDKNISIFNSPADALQYLETYIPSLKNSDLIKENNNIDYSRNKQSVDVQLSTLDLSALNHDISVLLVDYHMPEMSGLEFLSKIQELPCKKILITGETDFNIGITAFNKGLADAYIRKDDKDFPYKIREMINSLEWEYFTELSKVVYSLPHFNYLSNKSLGSAFKKYLQLKNIVSFHLADLEGTFSLRNVKGESETLIIRNRTQLKALSKVAKEDGADPDVIEQLEQGTAIPYFENNDFWQISAAKWGKYLYPSNPLADDPNILWASTN